MATRMQQRRGTEAQWTSADPILAAGEIGFESDTGQFKIGDGINHWSDLSYFKNLDDLGGTLDDYVPLTQKGSDNGVATLDSNGYIPVDQLGNLIGDAPQILDTIEEIASAINDANGIVASQIENAIMAEASDRDTAIENASLQLTGLINDEATARANAINEEVDARNQAITDAIGTHSSDTTNVHGIADTSVLVTTTTAQGYVSTHNSETTNVHGIADTSALATKTGTETLLNKTIDTANNTITVVAADISDVTATAAELNILDGATVSTAELNHVVGVTSAIQTQLDGKASTDSPTFTGTTTANNVTINGNLTVNGTTTTVNAQDLIVSDPLIYIGEDNTGDVLDLGLVTSFTDMSNVYQHAGLVRDASDGKWKLFSNVEGEPTTTVDFSNAEYDTLRLGGVEFSDGVQTKQGVPSLTEINQKTAAYTTVLSDRDKLVEVNSASGVTVTIPADADVAYPVGTSFDILQTGAGQVTIAGAGGVTVNATPGLKLRTQWSSATVFKRAANTWVVYGDLTA